jgi:hypothetical protein
VLETDTPAPRVDENNNNSNNNSNQTPRVVDKTTTTTTTTTIDWLQNKLRTISVHNYKETIFNPFTLLKIMDESNHVLLLAAIELLRTMVPIGKGSHSNLFPSSLAIQLVAAIVSKRGKLEVPYLSDHLPSSLGGGERVCWAVAKVLKLVAVATGLSELAKTQDIEFSVGMDGTRLYPGATLCVGGIKNNSPHRHSPILKIPNIKVNENGTVDTLTQSCENQIVTQICKLQVKQRNWCNLNS